MVTEKNTIPFDPGFAPYIMAFQGTVEYIYADINRFKNFSQRKGKFSQYQKKILEVFYNNLGFYTGCLLWAAYIKSQPKAKISDNSYLGLEYNEEAELNDVNYLIRFAELFPKDMKYFMSKDFSFDSYELKILETYREFLKQNKGFTITEFNSDIILPENVNTKNSNNFKNFIDNTISEGNLSKLFDKANEIIK